MARTRWIAAVLLTAVAGAGCRSGSGDRAISEAMAAGEFGAARSVALVSATNDLSDRRFLLDRQQVLWTALAEGDLALAADAADYTYDQLRSQGVNAGREFAQFLVGDRTARVWKGEPFEQAAAFYAVAACDGLHGDWGNVRASALSAAFQLRDLGSVVEGERSADPVQERVTLAEHVADTDEGIPLVASDFPPAYALAALAERRLGLEQDLAESVRLLKAVNPAYAPVADRIASGAYNTCLLIDFGRGPEKIQTGPDGAVAGYAARVPSTDAHLAVRVGDGPVERFPSLVDYNALAFDLKWNNFEDVRLAKSSIGSAMVAGGAFTALATDNSTAQLIGAGVALTGLLFKSTAGADTRHCVTLPQRTYMALLDLPAGGAPVQVQVDGFPGSAVSLPHLPSDGPGGLRLWYLRLPEFSPAWASGQDVRYANDATGPLPTGPTLPYVLGGRCLRTPSETLLDEYRAAGLPDWVQLADLLAVYREEQIAVVGFERGIPNDRHVADGGRALYAAAAGSAGFLRLYCQEHPPFTSTGPTAQRILAEMTATPAQPALADQ
jgi:hypothetical protein